VEMFITNRLEYIKWIAFFLFWSVFLH
jgi:hypothetical protein